MTSNYSKKSGASDKTKEDAEKIAKSTQRPGQTKEQTRLIAQGIKKGIEQYKKRQSAKTRELDKKLKKAAVSRVSNESSTDSSLEPAAVKSSYLPWLLLIISWSGFAAYIQLIK
jgi:hypothetical protein